MKLNPFGIFKREGRRLKKYLYYSYFKIGLSAVNNNNILKVYCLGLIRPLSHAIVDTIFQKHKTATTIL